MSAAEALLGIAFALVLILQCTATEDKVECNESNCASAYACRHTEYSAKKVQKLSCIERCSANLRSCFEKPPAVGSCVEETVCTPENILLGNIKAKKYREHRHAHNHTHKGWCEKKKARVLELAQRPGVTSKAAEIIKCISECYTCEKKEEPECAADSCNVKPLICGACKKCWPTKHEDKCNCIFNQLKLEDPSVDVQPGWCETRAQERKAKWAAKFAQDEEDDEKIDEEQ